MRKLLLSGILMLSIMACRKRSATVENESIVGKWKLTESLADPGDGSGKWQPADPAHPSFIEFKADGSLSDTPVSPYAASRYKVTSDSTLLFYRAADTLQERYHFEKTRLTIIPPCYEACGLHYVAVK